METNILQTLNTTEFEVFQDQVARFPSPRLVLRIRPTAESVAEELLATPVPSAILINLFFQCRDLGLVMSVTEVPKSNGNVFHDVEVRHPGDPQLIDASILNT